MAAPGQSSLIDRVNDADRPVGVIERGRVFREQAGFRVAHVFLFNPQGQLLIQQLGRRRDRNPLLWGSSIAAYVYASEAYWAAAARRLREELGLSTELAKHGSTFMIDQGCKKFIALYTTEASNPHIAEPEHIESMAFLPVEEIEDRLQRESDQFTETFRHVFAFYRATSDLP